MSPQLTTFITLWRLGYTLHFRQPLGTWLKTYLPLSQSQKHPRMHMGEQVHFTLKYRHFHIQLAQTSFLVFLLSQQQILPDSKQTGSDPNLLPLSLCFIQWAIHSSQSLRTNSKIRGISVPHIPSGWTAYLGFSYQSLLDLEIFSMYHFLDNESKYYIFLFVL